MDIEVGIQLGTDRGPSAVSAWLMHHMQHSVTRLSASRKMVGVNTRTTQVSALRFAIVAAIPDGRETTYSHARGCTSIVDRIDSAVS